MFKAITPNGTQVDMSSAIIALMEVDEKTSSGKIIGTTFFINAYGGFATAKHCVLDSNRDLIKELYAIQYIPKIQKAIPRKIKDIILSNDTDIAIGLLQTNWSDPKKSALAHKSLFRATGT
ncbi:hypothetical protein BH09BAC1_BH09BAC1_03030 [soil metagenome]